MRIRWIGAIALAAVGVAATCGPQRPDPTVIRRTEEVLSQYEGRDLIEVLGEYEQKLRSREERDPAARMALGRVFERLYDEREVLREQMVEGSPLSGYVSAHPGGSDLLAESAWLYASVASGRVPPELRIHAVRGLADVFRRKERDVTACVSEPLAQGSEFTWGLLRYVLLRCEVRLRAQVVRMNPGDAEALSALKDALGRLQERAQLLRCDPDTGETFRHFFTEVEEEAARAAAAEDPVAELGDDADAAFPFLSPSRHIDEGLNAKQTATELRVAQADPVGIFHQYERSLEHMVYALEVMCRLHPHEGVPSAQKREHVMDTLTVVLTIAQEMIYRR